MNDIFHSGEIEIQERVGEKMIATSNGRIVSDRIIAGAINFIEKQPMAIVSSTDATGQVWTSLLIGDFGFAKVPDPTVLVFDENMIRSTKNDIFYQNIKEHPEIGTLFIELESRRRFRIKIG